MSQYAMNKKTVNEAVSGGGLLVVAQWEAKEGQADRIADILSRFLPEAQNDPGAKLFLIGRSKENPHSSCSTNCSATRPRYRRIRTARISKPTSRDKRCRCSPSVSGRNTRCCKAQRQKGVSTGPACMSAAR